MASMNDCRKRERQEVAISACLVCARGKRRCGNERPCPRCTRLGRMVECLAGIPYESQNRMKRSRNLADVFVHHTKAFSTCPMVESSQTKSSIASVHRVNSSTNSPVTNVIPPTNRTNETAQIPFHHTFHHPSSHMQIPQHPPWIQYVHPPYAPMLYSMGQTPSYSVPRGPTYPAPHISYMTPTAGTAGPTYAAAQTSYMTRTAGTAYPFRSVNFTPQTSTITHPPVPVMHGMYHQLPYMTNGAAANQAMSTTIPAQPNSIWPVQISDRDSTACTRYSSNLTNGNMQNDRNMAGHHVALLNPSALSHQLPQSTSMTVQNSSSTDETISQMLPQVGISRTGSVQLKWSATVARHYAMAGVAMLLRSGIALENVLRMCMATLQTAVEQTEQNTDEKQDTQKLDKSPSHYLPLQATYSNSGLVDTAYTQMNVIRDQNPKDKTSLEQFSRFAETAKSHTNTSTRDEAPGFQDRKREHKYSIISHNDAKTLATENQSCADDFSGMLLLQEAASVAESQRKHDNNSEWLSATEVTNNSSSSLAPPVSDTDNQEDRISLVDLVDIPASELVNEDGDPVATGSLYAPAFEVLRTATVSRHELRAAEQTIGSCVHELLSRLSQFPFQDHIKLFSIPPAMAFRVKESIPPVVMQGLRFLANSPLDSIDIQKETMQKLKSREEFVDSLSNWANGLFEETQDMSLPLDGILKCLTELTKFSRLERIPFYDEIAGIICLHSMHPVSHVALDYTSGAPYEAYISEGMLSLLNVGPQTLAKSMGLVHVSSNNLGSHMLAPSVSDNTICQNGWRSKIEEHLAWIHPSIALPRAVAAIQAQRMNAATYQVEGRYLRQPHAAAGPSEKYSEFTAKEWLFICTNKNGQKHSQTHWFTDPCVLDTDLSANTADVGAGRCATRIILVGGSVPKQNSSNKETNSCTEAIL